MFIISWSNVYDLNKVQMDHLAAMQINVSTKVSAETELWPYEMNECNDYVML